ncbi:phospholipid transporting ATPase [Suhomyces tanzawaensis NRRL Y-17324]|uniref:Phospholipid-transporting ATPase n=1 Tax=Suhomyces tanzawaensis NRRL Y-17324 TaxID=984487 RepID=A0A1E4SQ15_9ASCO|nr:phospholipid transporting ATPase [Suhomyces tanzawaensis NRRL Y-17324]ODV81596.1 phospholipid transporting ATPase [Suhomyces tanzawaensis NRRL Y-17324]
MPSDPPSPPHDELYHDLSTTHSSFSFLNESSSHIADSRRVFSDESYHSANAATTPRAQSPSPSDTSFSNANSAFPTPNLNHPSRKTSLRFQLPQNSSPSKPHTPRIQSPFLDQRNVIMENETFDLQKPLSPFIQESFDLLKSDDNESEYYEASSADVDRRETTMKRNRWGTTRTKHGKPKKENLSRSKTLKALLNPSLSGSIRRRPGRNSIRRPNTSEDIIDEYGSDHNTDGDSQSEPSEPKEASDRRDEKRSIVFNKSLPAEFLDPETGKPTTNYARNKIRTTKYTPISFVPKNFSNQFIHNIANVYFLSLLILGAFDIFGVPSPVLAAVPLIVIVCITAIKDAIEDSRRTVTDLEVNNQVTHILTQVDPSSNFHYENTNVNDEKVSLWRKFKKANSKLLFKTIDKSKEKFTKEGRAQKMREKANEAVENPRNSFESYLPSARNSIESHNANPFTDGRPRGSQYSHRPARTLKFAKKYWKDVKVGDMLRIYNNDEIPADLIILATSDEDNCCYVETKNLDGETNLKVRQALKYGSVEEKISRADDLMSHSFQIDSEGPHANLYSYQGNLVYNDKQTNETKQEAVTINNLLLRGCSLRNTKWVVGIVAFTGNDTKIMLNAGITPTKQSRISRDLNYYVYLNFAVLFVICFVPGVVNGFYYRKSGLSRDFYEFGTIASTPATNGLVSFFVALILYQSLVPISLYITIEIIKTAQAFFIYSDVTMYYEKLDYPCTAKSWSISDDLGQIEYIFSDKTGTLTQNLMEFKKCTINGVSYGKAYTEALAGLRKRQGVDVESEALIEREIISKERVKMLENLHTKSKMSSLYDDELTFVSNEFVDDLFGARGGHQKQCNDNFMLALALCHSVLVEENPKNPQKLDLKAQSPDEAALVGTARSLGYNFKASTKKGVIVETHGVTKEYQILNALEFNSTRKRMSAIIKIPAEKEGEEPRALLICKGADSIIYGRLSKTQNDPNLLEQTSQHLEQYATEGLRTLCIAQRELTWNQYVEWNKRHKAAASSLDNREEQMEAVADSIERELTLLGGTAIEDRLQDGVPDAISLLGEAGIKLWVLTGDKVETAINIGFSCNLLGNDMELLLLKTSLNAEEIADYNITNYDDLSDANLIDYMISHFLSRYFNSTGLVEELDDAMGNHDPPDPGFGVVIDGDALKLALLDPDTKRKFLLLCKRCKAVLCCRVSPAQKAAVVKMVKDTLDVMTLAIGDGSNDVAMIQAADIGVGIAGEEGRQAVMSSDYAIGQFRFLAKLILAHGRWSYKRFSEMIPSFFYKNAIFTFALFWYGIYNDFDGTYLFEFTYLMFYNLAFTSLPVIFLGVFDQDVSGKVSLLVPQIYRSGITRSEWTEFKFWFYFIDAIYQSVISFFLPYCLYRIGFVDMSGRPGDHRFWMGIVVTSISCISCNLFILSHQYRWDWLSVLIVTISILLIFFWTGIWTSALASGEFYNAAFQVFGSATYWACTAVGIVICLMPRFFYDTLQKIYWPKDVDIIRECVQRGDFDMYPEDYDPTDPKRVKISKYSTEIGKMNDTPSPYTYKNTGSTTSSGSDFENQNNSTFGQSTAVPSDEPVTKLPEGASALDPRIMNENTTVQKVENRTLPQKRKSVLDIFKRKSKVMSYFDSSSIIDTYNSSNANSTLDLTNSIRTEEIAMDDFNNNQRAANRISSEVRRMSAQYGGDSTRDRSKKDSI